MELNPVKLFLDYHHRTSRIPQGARVSASLARHLGHVDSLLDIGCGDGVNTKRMAELAGASRVVGVDVHVREQCAIPVERYNGRDLPFPDRSFAAVMLVDVLHHCDDPQRVLDEAVRVADQMVVLKDHFAFGRVTRKMLHLMDIFGNAKDRIPSPGTYFDLGEWVRLIDHAKARMAALDWPLKTHDLPWRIVGWPVLQFTAKVVPL
jgi:SAM-dependent methyltransferase